MVNTAVLQIDTEDSTKDLSSETDTAIENLKKLKTFLSKRIIDVHGGKKLTYPGDGGTFCFPVVNNDISRSCKQALIAATEIIQSTIILRTFILENSKPLKLRFSIDLINLEESEIQDPTNILNPDFSWFTKYERKFTKKQVNTIFLSEDIFRFIGNYRDYCVKSHIVKKDSPIGKKNIQIFKFDLEKILRSELFFSFLHNLKKRDRAQYQFLSNNLEIIESTLESLHSTKNWKELLELREYLTHFFEIKGMYAKGIIAGKKFSDAATKLENKKALAWILMKDLGWLELMSDHHEEANKYFEKSAIIFREIKDHEGLGYYHRYKAILFYLKHNFELSKKELNLAEKEAELCQNEKKSALKARLLNNKGQNLFFQKKFQHSLNEFQQAHKEFELLNDIEHLAIAEINIGKVFFYLDDFENAEIWLEKGLKKAMGIFWQEGCGRAKYFLAKIFLKNNQMPAARIFAGEAKTIFENIGASKWIGCVRELETEIHQI